MSGDVHVQFCERPGVRFPPATHLEIATTGALLSPVRVEFRYEVVRQDDRALLATGRTVHAAVDGRGRPRRLPADVREVLA